MAEERFGSVILRSGGTWKSHPGFGFCIINETLFFLVFYEYYDGLYVVYMAMISLVFLLLLCLFCIRFMIVAMYGSRQVFTCK